MRCCWNLAFCCTRATCHCRCEEHIPVGEGEGSSGQFWSQQKYFINSNRLSKTVRNNSSSNNKSHSLCICGLITTDCCSCKYSGTTDWWIVPQISATTALSFGQGQESVFTHPDLVFWFLSMARSLTFWKDSECRITQRASQLLKTTDRVPGSSCTARSYKTLYTEG